MNQIIRAKQDQEEALKRYLATKEKTISIKEYEYLKERDMKLTSLEHAGVDNWEGYDFSIDIYDEMVEEETKIKKDKQI